MPFTLQKSRIQKILIKNLLTNSDKALLYFPWGGSINNCFSELHSQNMEAMSQQPKYAPEYSSVRHV